MSSPVPPPRFDLAESFPETGEPAARAAQDLPGALALLTARRPRGGAEYGVALDALAAADGLDEPLDRHLAEHPDDTEARVVRAARVVRRAWELRGTEPGAQVGAERFDAFFALLARAEQDLVRVVVAEPADTAAWGLRLSTARGLALGTSEAGRRWRHLRAADAHDVRAQREYLQHLTPKWGGDWGRVDAFVGEVTAAAAPGSAEWALVPYAALTRWYDDHRAEGTSAMRWPEVVTGLDAAEQSFLAAPTPSRYEAVLAHTDFAVALGLAGKRGRSAAHFAQLGPSLAPGTWALGADHRSDLENIRASALAEGRRR
ncbi:hypothetical protein [Phycicoccus flavus]|uniref:hypothetical protein n=1 Tax=Phycicoccus flavus TaxID=2502783 RepID=UPI000FEB6B8C|nr:hypothetical protein [Phycicoccus flavus]NHA69181.1 hypothetical protein [Phycicoccus flavus]